MYGHLVTRRCLMSRPAAKLKCARVSAENLVRDSDQHGCSPGRSAMTIPDHVPAVRVPPDYAAHGMAAAVAA